MPPTFGSESYRSTNPLEVIKPKETYDYFKNPEAIVGPDWIPEITKLTPMTAASSSPPFEIKVDGINLLPSSVIIFNGNAVPTIYVNPKQIKATVSPPQGPFPSKVPVQVRNNRTLSAPRNMNFNPTGE